ncbi:MAG: hypothetical protein WBJ95_05035 [Bacillota bacterium]
MRRVMFALMLVIIASFTIAPCYAVFAGGSESTEGVKLEVGTDQRKDLSLTVYNSDIALVRDTRYIQFARGLNLVELSGLATNIDPTSVSFKSLIRPGDIKTVEHNFDYAVVNRQSLLERYIGEEIWLISDGMRVSAKLLSVDGQGRLIVEIDGRIIIDPPGAVELPPLPLDLITRPTLVWHAEAKWTERHEVEIAYLTAGLSWSADYVCVLDDKDQSCALTGWVTLNNKSGATYRNAKVKLIAGDIHTLPAPLPTRSAAKTMMLSEAADTVMFLEEQAGFEYHAYTLPGTTTVADNQLKQVQLLESPKVSTRKLYVLESSGYRYPYDSSLYPGQSETRNAKTMLEFVNTEGSGLGMPLPAGRVRVYKALSDGSMDFIGEDRISHTPKDEVIRLYVGDSFDVVGERIVTDYKLGENAREEAYCIKVRNRKDEAIDVAVVEKLYGDWTISSPFTFEKRDANTAVFEVRVPGNSETEILFRVHTKTN